MPLSKLIDPSDNPANLIRVSKNKAVVSLTSNSGKEDSLVLTFDAAGKFVNSNVLRGSNVGSNYLVAGCKNSDDLILLEQECQDKSGNGKCSRFGKQVMTDPELFKVKVRIITVKAKIHEGILNMIDLDQEIIFQTC